MPYPVIVLAGPTATGKTALSVRLAQAVGGCILSADSRLVYQGLNIGTAKPTLTEQGGIPHYMMDCCPPTHTFTVAQYVAEAKPLLARLLASQPVIVVGGTGLYIQQLLAPLTVPPVPPDPAFRATLATLDNTQLHQRLQLQDARRAGQIHPSNRFRVIRALEIIAHTGQPVPDNSSPPPVNPDFTVHWLGLTVADRDLHRQWIAQRVNTMLQAGWLAEVNELSQQWGEHAQALQLTLGYPMLLAYTQGKLTLAQATEQTVIQVRQYARRQRTWFNHHANLRWTAVDRTDMSFWLDTMVKLIQP
jgi:tRNA dimethylallyltransferase